jgi:dipeptidyl-peptidase-4
MKKLTFATFLWVASLMAWAQEKPALTIEDIFQKGTFAQNSVHGVNWMQNGQFYTSELHLPTGEYIVKYQITNGQIVDTLANINQIIQNNSAGMKSYNTYQLNPDETQLLLQSETQGIYRRSTKANYFIYDLKTKKLTRLSAGGKQSNATFSPDGSKVAFTRENNLFVADLKTGQEKQLTTDGKFNEIIHGMADWVYEEEFSFTRAFQWSPDSKKIAYYTFDERKVPEYNMQIWGGLYPVDYRFKYPKAGESNSVVGLSVYHLDKNQAVKMDIGSETDMYIPRINFTHDANLLSIRRMNRLQNQLDILHADATTGASKVVVTEKSEAYVDLELTDDLTYLANGKQFIHSSERSGFKHLYLYTLDGKLVQQLTNGNWEVKDVLGLDEKNKTLYFTSYEVSPLETHLYRIGLDGKGKQQLTKEKGTHTIDFSQDFSFYLDYHSTANTPLTVSLHQAPSGKVIKVLEDNKALKARLDQYELSSKEFFQFKTPDNVNLNGFMIKPTNFDASKKHPVLMFVYGGPGSQMVTDSWDGSNGMWFKLLAQKGFIVVSVDNRGTGARGTAFRQVTYANLGKFEVQDQIEGAKYLGTLPYIDKSRIGIYGWSYGGYMASLCMTLGADYFKAGIAGAPVTSWRFYDTIYTERYLKTPQLNPQGYDAFSPLTHVGKLKGKFLLIHGTGDDNVHFQNSVSFADALIKAGKQFQSFYYPNQSHGVRGLSKLHLQHLMTNFIVENLQANDK